MNTNYATVQKAPSAYVTKNKQRIKQHEGTVYLQNGDTFEIEIYNPTQNRILANISLNQESLGGGIVLRPGERVFLERYLNENRKFKFDTYEVENSIENEFATYKNGYVEVTFHKEKIYQNSISWSNTTSPYYTYYNHTGSPVFGGNTTTSGDVTFSTTGMVGATANSFMDMEQQAPDLSALRGTLSKPTTMETGRIEKGGASNQDLKTVNYEFDTFSFHNVSWRILPKSRKPLTSSEVNKRYCTECGARVKKASFKFCPHCGTKVD